MECSLPLYAGDMDHERKSDNCTFGGDAKMDPLAKGEMHFSVETMESLRELGAVLERIHWRLVSEGYVITNGTISRKQEITDV
jgi:hypothetical protein